MTYTCRDDDTAFTACKAALEKHNNDEECVLFIKELMIFCPVSSQFEEDMQIASDYVVKKSSQPVCVGVAWFRKADHLYRNDKFNECISFCDIALKNLSYDEGKCNVEGNISQKDMFEILTLIRKKQCFEHLEQPKKIEETEKALMRYPTYVRHFYKTNK